jgi:hypothetical protein
MKKIDLPAASVAQAVLLASGLASNIRKDARN